MTEIKANFDSNGTGGFYILENEQQLGAMEAAEQNQTLVVYHTEVNPEAEGKGIARELLTYMVNYARDRKLKVSPLCPYVHAQFKRHPDLYEDVWLRN